MATLRAAAAAFLELGCSLSVLQAQETGADRRRAPVRGGVPTDAQDVAFVMKGGRW